MWAEVIHYKQINETFYAKKIIKKFIRPNYESFTLARVNYQMKKKLYE